ncbi:MAG: 2,3-diaminopropionate biosynthesis protein SbnB [Verrucomicrobia bacterium]|nr:2,3-diaminopropionate biosynthesis protein SbnB [Verrucomicrobiota bacterium]
MKFINESWVENNRLIWSGVLDILLDSVEALYHSSYAQPIKPYLRFGNPKNRIIAMPAFVGGKINAAGIKWIASFPDNYLKGLPRANALIILNDTTTGVPLATIEGNRLSAIRTAGVSGLILKPFFESRKNAILGFSGYGFIAKNHLEMIKALYPEKISKIYIFDQRNLENEKIDFPNAEVQLSKTWEEAYEASDLFITCTTTNNPYITLFPKEESLHLDVSLRDYNPEIVMSFDQIVVDNWEEVCRENTDIERAHLSLGLQKKDTLELAQFLKNIPSFIGKKTFFAPMGMAIFDIALANAVYLSFLEKNFENKS